MILTKFVCEALRVRRVAAIALWVAVLCLVPACGKKGSPVPQDQKNLFAWQDAQATLTPSGCFSILASMTGATHNVDSFTLEIEPITEEVCLECPFTPREVVLVTPEGSNVRSNNTVFAFSHCSASSAPAFRWRLVARNVFSSFPHALTKYQYLQRDVASGHVVPVQ